MEALPRASDSPRRGRCLSASVLGAACEKGEGRWETICLTCMRIQLLGRKGHSGEGCSVFLPSSHPPSSSHSPLIFLWGNYPFSTLSVLSWGQAGQGADSTSLATVIASGMALWLMASPVRGGLSWKYWQWDVLFTPGNLGSCWWPSLSPPGNSLWKRKPA